MRMQQNHKLFPQQSLSRIRRHCSPNPSPFFTGKTVTFSTKNHHHHSRFHSSSSSQNDSTPNDNITVDREVHAFLEGGPLTPTSIQAMELSELRQELANRKMDTTGSQEELIERLASKIIEGTDTESLHREVKESTELLDSESIYFLRTKGHSSFSWDGTGVGIVLQAETGQEWTARKFLAGNRSMFEAEYTAMILGLRYAIRRNVKKIVLQIENHVIAKQMSGHYQVKKESLIPLHRNLVNLRDACLDHLEVVAVPPKENELAQEMATKALSLGKSLYIDDADDPMSEIIEERIVDSTKSVKIDQARHNDSPGTIEIHPSQKYVLQFDGGARGNPTGSTGIGMVIYDQAGTEIWCGWKYLGTMSNNAAEYHAILTGLECARSLGIRKIRAEGDSNLVVRQLTGVYKVKAPNLQVLWGQTMEVLKDFETVEIVHIPRAQNERADWLANKAMDIESSYGFHEIK